MSDQEETAENSVIATSAATAAVDGSNVAGATGPVSLSRRHLLMGVGMIAASGIALARPPERRFPAISDEKFDAIFPKAFGDWQIIPASELIMPPESELANKLYEHILTRSYRNAQGEYVMLLLAYSSKQIDDVQVHRPEVCYRVAGFSIDRNDLHQLKINDKISVPARVVLANRQFRQEHILYWTRVGSDFPGGWAAQRFSMLKANLEGYFPDGILVRASVVVDDASKTDPMALLTSFYRQLTAHASPEAMRLLYNV